MASLVICAVMLCLFAVSLGLTAGGYFYGLRLLNPAFAGDAALTRWVPGRTHLAGVTAAPCLRATPDNQASTLVAAGFGYVLTCRDDINTHYFAGSALFRQPSSHLRVVLVSDDTILYRITPVPVSAARPKPRNPAPHTFAPRRAPCFGS